jgi:hypothetical protein
MNTQPVHVAGRYGYLQVTPTVAERARGYESAWMVVDFGQLDDNGTPMLIGDDAMCSRAAAIAEARELHRYYSTGGDRLNSAAISEWVAELTA